MCFSIKRCVGGRICHECGDLELFHRKFPIDPTHPGLSGIAVKWKRYEYVSLNPSSSSLHMFHLRGSTCSRMIFLFQTSWMSFKVKFTNTLNTPISLGGKLQNLSILMRFLSQEQSYRWQTLLRITHFLLRERYKVSIITPTRCPYSNMYCIDMLR